MDLDLSLFADAEWKNIFFFFNIGKRNTRINIKVDTISRIGPHVSFIRRDLTRLTLCWRKALHSE